MTVYSVRAEHRLEQPSNVTYAIFHDKEKAIARARQINLKKVVAVTERCDVAMPKRKRASRPVIVKDGVIYTEGAGEQLSLLTRSQNRENS